MLVNNKISKERAAWKLPTRKKELLSGSFTLKYFLSRYLRTFYYDISQDSRTPIAVDCLPGSFFLGHIDIFKKTDYFDEGTFLYYEEIIIAMKIKNLGLHNYIITEATYLHKESSSINNSLSFIKKHKILLDSKIYFWKKYRRSSQYFILALKVLFRIWTIEYLTIKLFRKNWN